ncbi:MAG TPA: hypothetical protein VIL37_12760 [Natronosporangium sp.]
MTNLPEQPHPPSQAGAPIPPPPPAGSPVPSIPPAGQPVPPPAAGSPISAPPPIQPAPGGPGGPPYPPLPPGAPPPPVPDTEPPIVVDILVRIAGALVAFGGGAVAAWLAVLLIPLRVSSFGISDGGGVGATRIPIAIVLAVAGNAALVWVARHGTGFRWAVLLPGLSWFAVIAVAMLTTPEGDRLLMPDDWVGAITLFGGTITFVICAVIAVAPSRARTPYHRSP